MAVGQNSYVTHMKQHLPFVLIGVIVSSIFHFYFMTCYTYSLSFHSLLINIPFYHHTLFTEVVWNTTGDLGVSLLLTKEMGHSLMLNLLNVLLTHWHQRDI